MLTTLIITAALGSLLGHQAAYALFWAIVALVSAVAVTVFAGARPLPRLADRSHLLHRLSWLARYGTGAVLLCVSTFVGGLAGSAVAAGTTESQLDALTQLIGVVGAYAFQIALVIFLGWLAIDMWRLTADARTAGFTQGGEVGRWPRLGAGDVRAGRGSLGACPQRTRPGVDDRIHRDRVRADADESRLAVNRLAPRRFHQGRGRPTFAGAGPATFGSKKGG